ncbi:hypothetical protein FRC01_010050, partial [Tulasnella sp. 417]
PDILPKLWYGRAFTSLWLTCRALHAVGEQVRRRLHVIADRSPPKGFLDLERFSEFHKNEPKPEIIMQGHSVSNILLVAITSVVGLERLELVDLSVYKASLQMIASRSTLRRLKIRSCHSNKSSLGLPSSFQDANLPSIIELRDSKISQLELDYTSWNDPNIPREVAFLTFMPTLTTLVLCGKSFIAAAQLARSLSPPSLRHLAITDNQPPLSITKSDAVDYLRRFPTLETLDFGVAIDAAASAPALPDIPANLPNLKQYEGPAELLALLKCPNLLRVVVKGCEWNSGNLVQSLAAASPALQTLIVELTTRAEDPICRDIKVSNLFQI